MSHYAYSQLSYDETRYSEISALHASAYADEHNRTFFRGNIGEYYSITLELSSAMNWLPGKSVMLRGHYTYDQYPMKIMLDGWQHPDGTVSLNEITNGQITGMFQGVLSAGGFEGTWIGKKTKATYSVSLTEYIPGGVALIQTKHISANNKQLQTQIEKSSTFNIVYPVINNVDGAEIINRQIEENILTYVQSHAKHLTIDNLKSDFQNSIAAVEGVCSELVAAVELNTNGILSVLFYHVEAEYDSPGSVLTLTYHHFRTDNGQVIVLTDIIQSDRIDDLAVIVQQALEKKYADNQLEYVKGVFSLSDNFSMMPNGLLFQYNAHEISISLPELPSVFLSYCDMEDMLNTESIAYPMIQNGLF